MVRTLIFNMTALEHRRVAVVWVFGAQARVLLALVSPATMGRVVEVDTGEGELEDTVVVAAHRG
jgi:hypothetical protein